MQGLEVESWAGPCLLLELAGSEQDSLERLSRAGAAFPLLPFPQWYRGTFGSPACGRLPAGSGAGVG